ncbi:MAG TPA: class II aldolase/adducin family protein [Kofleriaceae bacterium]|nr:class II aldolase/adducin family protein [Kofleriaceae bacterium]
MDRGIRAQLAETARAMHQRGWVANHDGNASARLGPGRFLVTPTATSKADVDERRLVEVDGAGQPVGSGRAFGEIGLHLAVYAARADVAAVVHAHPPYATALACSGSALLERPFIAEAVVSLGPSIPTLPFAAPGKPAAEALAAAAGDVDAVLVANHGALAWGATLEQAYLRLELVEHLARIATLAQATGGIRALPDQAIGPLLEARARAKLGAAADRAVELWRGGAPRPVVACAPAPHSPTPTIAPGRPARADVAAVVREELLRALRER